MINFTGRYLRFTGLVLCWFVLSCSKPTYTPPPEDEIELPKTMQLTDEEFEQYLLSQDPDIEEEIEQMERKLKRELGVADERIPTPPPGWNLENALESDNPSKRIYRWVDEYDKIRITEHKPPAGAKILGWRYADQPTPTIKMDKGKTVPSQVPDGEGN